MHFSKQVLLTDSDVFRRTILGTRISWKQSDFLIVLHNQFHDILLDLPLTRIHSFKSTMVSSDFEIPQSFIVENVSNVLILI